MKFKVTMKDPDCLYESVEEAVKTDLRNVEGLSDAERATLVGERSESTRDTLRRWFKYGEYLTVEIDTEKMTATVCEA